MVTSKEKIPLLRCFPVSDAQVAAWCPFCEKWHLHGFTDEIKERKKAHRVAHCSDFDSPLRETGYYLKLMTKADVKRIGESLEFYPPRK